tara:strand:- start:1656 stop:1763 length:108 start_codon:yes stop_codon:yes gene_type:complete
MVIAVDSAVKAKQGEDEEQQNRITSAGIKSKMGGF